VLLLPGGLLRLQDVVRPSLLHLRTTWRRLSGKRKHPGVDVMITIFCDFPQFSANKLAFFINTNVTITFFSKFGFVSSQKRQVSLNFSSKRFKKS
jgi:hypothetical protein